MNGIDIKSGMGAFICELRKEKGLTQKQLAEHLHVTDKAVSKWERELGCPDITTLPLLAQVLGVSASELLECQRAKAPVPEAETLVHTTLRYSEKTTKEKKRRALTVTFMILTVSILIGAIVCIICDLAISGRFTWAVYPLASMALTWLVLLPLFMLERHAVAGSLAMCSVSLPVFLLILEQATGADWFWRLGLPISIISLAYAWCGFWLFTRKGLNKWYAGGIVCLLAAPLTLSINMLSSLYAGDPLLRPWDITTVLGVVVIALILFAVGWSQRQKAK